MEKVINILQVGAIYNHKGYPVVITDGEYMGTHGISNFWYWRRINNDGTLGKTNSGYNNRGKFTKCPDKYLVVYVKQSKGLTYENRPDKSKI